VIALLISSGCVVRKPVKPSAVNSTPLPPDAAMQIREWPQQTAWYRNGATVSGPTGYVFEVKEDEPEWTYYYADFGTWVLNTALLPVMLVVEPQWTQAISRGEWILPTYTAQPVLPPQVLPGYVPKGIRPPVAAPITTMKTTTTTTTTTTATKPLPPTTRPVTTPSPRQSSAR
jgi:hypothetical protein